MTAVKKTAGASARKVPKKVRILIVDDHPMMREGLAHSINHEPDLMACDQACSAAEALEAIARSKPDLVLTDITLPGRSGLELIKDVVALHPALPILVISMHTDAVYAERALHAGARGYINKQEACGKLIEAIRKVWSGEIYASATTEARILNLFSGRSARADRCPLGQLTDREFEIVQWIGEGLPTKEIGARLMISAKTVEAHRVNIKRKLGLSTSTELSVYAARLSASDVGNLGST